MGVSDFAESCDSLDVAFNAIAADMPWGRQARFIVGSLASRESVKDIYFELFPDRPVIPAWSICSLGNLSREVLTRLQTGIRVLPVIPGASQGDVLESVARRPRVMEAAPRFCKHLKSRQVSLKVARFLSQLDLFYVSETDREAILECLQEREPEFGAFLSVINQLWAMGELRPWGEGDAIRAALEALRGLSSESAASSQNLLPQTVYLWAFPEYTPLEEEFLQELSRFVKIVQVRTEKGKPVLERWEPHSPWDEFAFLHDSLQQLIEDGKLGDGRWSDVAISIPNDDLYKRLVRAELHSWNLPLRDPTLSGLWRENPNWVWWRDFLKAVGSGLASEDVRSLLGPGRNKADTEMRRQLYEEVYRRGVFGSASQWRRLSQKFPIPELKLIVEATGLFSRVMSPQQFQDSVTKLITLVQSSGAEAHESEILLEFAQTLIESRPYLEDFKGRLNRYIPLYEEFLESRGRRESLRCMDGIWFVGHGVWVPRTVQYHFVLGSNGLEPRILNDDPLSWDGPWRHENEKVKRLWSRLHQTETIDERRARESDQLAVSLRSTSHLILSQPSYGLSGKPWSHGAFAKKFLTEMSVLPVECAEDRKGGAEIMGWDRGFKTPLQVSAVNLQAQLPEISKLWTEKPLRVSAFEDFLKCPFLFYARHVLKLEPDPELSLDLGGKVKGTLLHRILERFLRTELEEGAILEFARGEAFLETLLDQEFALGPLEGIFRDASLAQKARSFTSSLLQKWWVYECEQRTKFPTLKPYKVELDLTFQLLPGLNLKGRADRIDSDGTHAVVIDYKSGMSAFIGKELLAGMGSQLLMYAQALRNSHNLEPAGVWYLEITKKVSGKSGVFLKKHKGTFFDPHARNSGLVDKSFDEVLEPVVEHWQAAAEKLLAGDFTPAPARPKECYRCSFKPHCGYPVGKDLTDESE